MDQTHITIKFKPLIKNVGENCCLQIIPELSSIDNTVCMDWDDGEHLEYNIPVIHKVIIKKQAKDFVADDTSEVVNGRHEQAVMNDEIEQKVNLEPTKLVKCECLNTNNEISITGIDKVYSAGDSFVEKNKRHSLSNIEVLDLQPTSKDYIVLKNKYVEAMALDNEVYRQMAGRSADISIDRVAFYKQLLRHELMPLRLEMDNIINKCDDISLVPYNNFSTPVTHSRTHCCANRFVYTVTSDG